MQGLLAAADLSLIAQARTLLAWHQRHRYCANCGSLSEAVDGGYRRHCPACGLDHFPRAEVLVSRTEYELAQGFMGKVRGYVPHRWPASFAPRLLDLPATPFGSFERSMALTEAGDVRIVATPGHTPGHLSVVLAEDDGYVFFAGDASYEERLMLAAAVDGVAPDPAVARDTLERIRRFAHDERVVYLPAHDTGAAARLAERRPAPV